MAVTFVYSDWVAAYPQFSNVAQATITGPVLTIAEQYCRNDGGGPVCDATLQTQLLWLMVAHVAQLMYGSTTQPLSQAVGRVASAGQGSVNVALEWPTTASNAFFLQTQYGAMWWQMTSPFRLGIYGARNTPSVNPWAGPQRW